MQDVSACTSCKQADVSKLMEFDLPAGMLVSDVLEICMKFKCFCSLASGMEESLRKL